jgi:hypothetical protein
MGGIVGGRWWVAFVLFSASAASALLLNSSGARAETFPSSGSKGYDVSWPQCGGSLPAAPFAFGIVGVTGGKSFSPNTCLATEYAWAQQGAASPMVYMNLNAPPRNSLRSADGPAGKCLRKDFECQAYNYGWNAADYAWDYAVSKGVDVGRWWLDIETGNTWSRDKSLNAITIGAAIDYLEAQTVTVGIYSTAYQWGVIAGSYAPGLDLWAAGASSEATAPSRCSSAYAFAGGAVVLVQWVETYDRNYVC